jgi:hypothetical protein
LFRELARILEQNFAGGVRTSRSMPMTALRRDDTFLVGSASWLALLVVTGASCAVRTVVILATDGAGIGDQFTAAQAVTGRPATPT